MWLIFGGVISAYAQELRVSISIASTAPTEITIAGELSPATDTWSFRNSYAGVLGLGERINDLKVFDHGGELFVRKLAPGEFRSQGQAARFRYRLDAREPVRRADLSHVSWLAGDRGVLMLADLLPQVSSGAAVLIEFHLPLDWRVDSVLEADQKGRYATSEPDKAVFFVGPSLRQRTRRIQAMEIKLITSGEWGFRDDDVTEIAVKVMKDYLKVTGFSLGERCAVILAPFPGAEDPGRWSAETRGSTVVLLLGHGAPRKDSLARLGVIFTHELFHFWVPNALRFNGYYDWFFEGFTLYEALRTALRLGLIDFQEYLNTIARVYDSYLRAPDRDHLSLLQASERRWTESGSLVYDKGMLIAFLYDLTLRQNTDGKSSLDDVYKQLFRLSRNERRDGNEAIISVLGRFEMKPFIVRYVEEHGTIELETLVVPYGLRISSSGVNKRVAVAGQLTADQLRLMRSLGYRH